MLRLTIQCAHVLFDRYGLPATYAAGGETAYF